MRCGEIRNVDVTDLTYCEREKGIRGVSRSDMRWDELVVTIDGTIIA